MSSLYYPALFHKLMGQSSHLLDIEILHNIEICHLQMKKRRFIRLSSKFYYKWGR